VASWRFVWFLSLCFESVGLAETGSQPPQPCDWVFEDSGIEPCWQPAFGGLLVYQAPAVYAVDHCNQYGYTDPPPGPLLGSLWNSIPRRRTATGDLWRLETQYG
jgi:hypothetical protein